MLVTEFTRKALAIRREMAAMKRNGYERCEPHWELIRGGRWQHDIVDAKISVDGRHIWFKTELVGR